MSLSTTIPWGEEEHDQRYRQGFLGGGGCIFFTFLVYLLQKHFFEMDCLCPALPQPFRGQCNGGLRFVSCIMGWISDNVLSLCPSNISFNDFALYWIIFVLRFFALFFVYLVFLQKLWIGWFVSTTRRLSQKSLLVLYQRSDIYIWKIIS